MSGLNGRKNDIVKVTSNINSGAHNSKKAAASAEFPFNVA